MPTEFVKESYKDLYKDIFEEKNYVFSSELSGYEKIPYRINEYWLRLIGWFIDYL